MARWNFLTVPDELLGEAVAIATHFDGLGYHVTAEPRELGYPFTPTLRCDRSPTTLLVEVSRRAQVDRLSEWAAYASACEDDTRVTVGLPDAARIPQKQNLQLSKLGVGLLIVSAGQVTETLAPRDLSMNVNLPRISRDAVPIRTALGAVYEHFNRSNWREGFSDACVVFEDACRKYLWKAISSGRTGVLKENGQPKVLTRALVDGMTMGQLAATSDGCRSRTIATASSPRRSLHSIPTGSSSHTRGGDPRPRPCQGPAGFPAGGQIIPRG